MADTSATHRRRRGRSPPDRSDFGAEGGSRRRDSGSALARRVPLGHRRNGAVALHGRNERSGWKKSGRVQRGGLAHFSTLRYQKIANIFVQGALKARKMTKQRLRLLLLFYQSWSGNPD